MSTIEEVKARLDIVETVGSYVPTLKKSGRTYKSTCPFHNERTPSFTVDPDRGTWHCFGACSTGGDVIEFVRRIEGLDFKQALERCAERAGVELRPASSRERQQREAHDRLLRANDAAAVFFQSHLVGPEGVEARSYLDARGVDVETRQAWQLGYAPEGWRSLIDHLTARGFTEGDLVEAGLAIRNDNGGIYDRFRNRLIFPTRDVRGRMIGFGARALSPDDEPKYLNTPQTPLFDKSASLYGIDRAHDEARRADRIVVVEGYMDVIASHQFGLRNVVASMGTAITERQMSLIKRYTQNVVVALDADTAGAEATLRAVEIAAESADHTAAPTVDWRGLVSYQDVLQADIRVAALPAGEDPDSLVRKDPEALRALIDAARPVVDHLFEAVSAQFDLSEPRARSRALDALAPSVAAIVDPVVRAHYVQRLGRMTRMDERAILALLDRRRGRGPAPVPTAREVQGARRAAATAAATPPDGEVRLLQLLLHREEARAALTHLDGEVFEDSMNRRVFEAWCATPELPDHVEDADDDVRERLDALLAERPEWLDPIVLEARHVAEMAESWADGLRRHRQIERLRPAARDVAAELTKARRASMAAAVGAGMPAIPIDDASVFDLEAPGATLEDGFDRGTDRGFEARFEPAAPAEPAADPDQPSAAQRRDEVAMELEEIVRRQRELAQHFKERRNGLGRTRSEDASATNNQTVQDAQAVPGGPSSTNNQTASDDLFVDEPVNDPSDQDGGRRPVLAGGDQQPGGDAE
ncbi:MAG: DNA primase [Dehalococcoidia bacterium]